MKALQLVFTFLFFTIQFLIAQVPQTTSFQGLLTDSESALVADGDYLLNFKLYDVAASGTLLWEETQLVATVGGIFNVILGKVNLLDLPFDKHYWLEMSIDGGDPLSPRVELTSSFYSLMTKSIEDSTISTTKLQDNAVTTVKLADESVTQAKLSPSVSIPPGGEAGGDLVGIYPNPTIAENAITSEKIADNTITTAEISTNLLSSIDGVDNDGGDVDLVGGSNITITPDNEGNTITISADGVGGGDITSVTAGDGLTGGGSSGDVAVNVVGGEGISVTADELAINTTYTDGRYVNAGEANSVTSAMITNNTITQADVATNMLSSIDGVSNDGGNVDLVAGSNITLTPDDGANTITIAAATGVGDNLGNHTATQSIKLNGNYLSGDGSNEGVFIANNGNVGVGTINPLSKLCVGGDGFSVYGGYFEVTDDWYAGIVGVATGANASGVVGSASYSGSGQSFGGYFTNQGESGTAVYGYATNSGDVVNYGGYFIASGKFGRGVYGIASDNSSGYTNYGGYFSAASEFGRGVYGKSSGSVGYGVYGEANSTNGTGISGVTGGAKGKGVSGMATNTEDNICYGGSFSAASVYGRGVSAYASGAEGRGVVGLASNSGNVVNYGGYFASSGISGFGVYGSTGGTSGSGVFGIHDISGNYGVLGHSIDGVQGWSNSSTGSGVAGIHNGSGKGIYGKSESGWAGYFDGGVHVSGTFSKSAGSFKIDHPLDPENKYLYHSFVESPDMKNIYDGNVTTDADGNADVKLPEWFEALNKDFRYQLTVIGEFAQAIVSEEINNNYFSIKTDKPNVKVSWQVTGIRNDAYAIVNRIPIEETKSIEDRGKYLNPEVFGMPVTDGVSYNEDYEQDWSRMEEQLKDMESIMMEEEQRMQEERIRMEQEEVESKRIRLQEQPVDNQRNLMGK